MHLCRNLKSEYITRGVIRLTDKAFNFLWTFIGLCMNSKRCGVLQGNPCCPLFPIQYEMQLLCLTFYSQSATLDHLTRLISFPSKELP